MAALGIHAAIRAANTWRDRHNPLRGLTIAKAVQYLEEGDRGAYSELQWLYRYIERRDATLRGGKRHLISAVSGMDWEIKQVEESRLPAGFTKAQAEAQAVTLRTAYDAIVNLTEAIEFLALAEFRGFAHLEKVWEGGRIVRLAPIEQWYWCRRGLTGEWQYNRDARPGRVQGESVDPAGLVVREIDDPINEIALLCHVRKQLGRKDEDGYIESFGVPSIFAIMPPNVPQGREGEYQDLAEQVIGDSRGALPHGADIKTVEAGGRGVAPFRAYQEALDKEMVMAITSGALTMLAESGTGTLAGGAHSETFMRVARALARRISATLQEQFDLAILAAAHPGQPPLAYFDILSNEETDIGEVVKDVASLKAAGFAVDASWLEEKTGYPVHAAAAVTPPVPGAGKVPALPNRKPDVRPDEEARRTEPEDITEEFLAEALGELSAAMQSDCKPVADRIAAILSTDQTDDQLRAALEQLRADLPDLAQEVAAGPEVVKAWGAILAAAMGNEISADATDED